MIPSGEGKYAEALRLTACRPFMAARAPAIPAACNVSAACQHVVTALLPTTVTPGHSSVEAQGAISPPLSLSTASTA